MMEARLCCWSPPQLIFPRLLQNWPEKSFDIACLLFGNGVFKLLVNAHHFVAEWQALFLLENIQDGLVLIVKLVGVMLIWNGWCW
jgi:hypothetical protein